MEDLLPRFRGIESRLTDSQVKGIHRGFGYQNDVLGALHSQSGQDGTVIKILNMTGGYFVDLAANEPIYLSNTRALERDYGWDGVCVDGNDQMLERLVQHRRCRVIKGAVTAQVGGKVTFLTPVWDVKAVQAAREGKPLARNAMSGILSNSTDLKSDRGWVRAEMPSTTLMEILQHVRAPRVVNYLSLDIEGAEYEALRTFDFSRYRFDVMTIERPNAALRALLRANSYGYALDHGCFGDQLWVHSSISERAARALGVQALPDRRHDFHGRPTGCHGSKGPPTGIARFEK